MVSGHWSFAQAVPTVSLIPWFTCNSPYLNSAVIPKEAFSDCLAQVESPYTLKTLSFAGWPLQSAGGLTDK